MYWKTPLTSPATSFEPSNRRPCQSRQGTIASGATEPFVEPVTLVLCVVNDGVDVVVAVVGPTDSVVPRRAGDLRPFGLLVTMLCLVAARIVVVWRMLYDKFEQSATSTTFVLITITSKGRGPGVEGEGSPEQSCIMEWRMAVRGKDMSSPAEVRVAISSGTSRPSKSALQIALCFCWQCIQTIYFQWNRTCI